MKLLEKNRDNYSGGTSSQASTEATGSESSEFSVSEEDRAAAKSVLARRTSKAFPPTQSPDATGPVGRSMTDMKLENLELKLSKAVRNKTKMALREKIARLKEEIEAAAAQKQHRPVEAPKVLNFPERAASEFMPKPQISPKELTDWRIQNWIELAQAEAAAGGPDPAKAKQYSAGYRLVLDTVLEHKVKGWTLPKITSLIDIYWPIPRLLDMSDEAVKRRDYMTGKVLAFWANVYERCPAIRPNGLAGHSFVGPVDPKGVWFESRSYRVTLAEQLLSAEIERYASNYRAPELNPSDEVLEGQIKAACVRLLAAHRPLLDGDYQRINDSWYEMGYVEYMGVLEAFDWPKGTLLHEVS